MNQQPGLSSREQCEFNHCTKVCASLNALTGDQPYKVEVNNYPGSVVNYVRIKGPGVFISVEVKATNRMGTESTYKPANVCLHFQQDLQAVVYSDDFNNADRHYKIDSDSKTNVTTLHANVLAWGKAQVEARERAAQATVRQQERDRLKQAGLDEAKQLRERLLASTLQQLKGKFVIGPVQSDIPEARYIRVQVWKITGDTPITLCVREDETVVELRLATTNDNQANFLAILEKANLF